MRPTAIMDQTRIGDLGGKKIKMQVDPENMGHIMSVLTDLYKDPEMAVLREYATNARDAHIEAGVQRPIEVSLPSPLSPTLEIRDFGKGLSYNEIEDIYSRYGASTKRESDDFVGMLGLGCKSGLSYAPSFYVKSIQNGHLLHVSVTRDEFGQGIMEVLDSASTAEPDGLTIVIPAKRYHEFADKAKFLFSFWQEGTVLVDGREPERPDEHDIQFKDFDGIERIAVRKHMYMSSMDSSGWIVMGNVPYPTNVFDGFVRTYGSDRFDVVVYAAIGSVNFTPAREQLHMTARTQVFVNAAKEFVKEQIADVALESVSSAGSAEEAFKIASMWANLTPGTGKRFSYDSMSVPGPGSYARLADMGRVINGGNYGNRRGGIRTMAYSELHKVKYVVLNAPENVTPTVKAKVEMNVDGAFTLITSLDKVPWHPWIVTETLDWADIKSTKLPRKMPATGRRSWAGKVWMLDGYDFRLQELDEDGPFVIVPQKVRKDYRWLNGICDMPVVALPVNRMEKFVKDNPGSIPAWQWRNAELEKAYNGLTDDDKIRLTMGGHREKAVMLADAGVLDPRISRLGNALKGANSPNVNRYYALVGKYPFHGWQETPFHDVSIPHKFDVERLSVDTDPFKMYTLLESTYITQRNIKHVVIYMNAVYAQTVVATDKETK